MMYGIGECSDYSKTEKPIVVCLCGSTSFYEEFQKASLEETMNGKIVLSIGFYSHSSIRAHGEKIDISPETRIMLEELQFKKIDISDEVLILNKHGYIGESTKKELDYAIRNGKIVRFLEANI